MLHLRFVQAIIACAPYAHSSYGLGKCPLDARSCLISQTCPEHTFRSDARMSAQPDDSPLLARSGFWVRRRTNDPFVFVSLGTCSPFGLPARQVILLLPDLAEQGNTGLILERLRSIGHFQGLQQVQSVSTDLLG
jgi:hypothetical protein